MAYWVLFFSGCRGRKHRYLKVRGKNTKAQSGQRITLTHLALQLRVKYIYFGGTYRNPSPSGRQGSVHSLHHVWSTHTYRRQQAGGKQTHRPQSRLSGFHCCLVTEILVPFFSGFKFSLGRPPYLCGPAARGSGFSSSLHRLSLLEKQTGCLYKWERRPAMFNVFPVFILL